MTIQTTHPRIANLAFLDHIRGFAILSVFLFHCVGVAYGIDTLKWGDGWWRDLGTNRSFLMLMPLTYGWLGVPVFFLVSGFCIHMSFQRSATKSFSSFFIRRIFRIYPPYLALMLLFSFVYPWRHLLFDPRPVGQFASHFFLVHNFHPDFFMGINPAFWSIAIEFQLYLLYPLLWLAVNKWGWKKTLCALALIEIGIRCYIGISDGVFRVDPPYLLSASPLTFWFSWSLGAWGAEAYLKGKKMPLQDMPVWFFPLCVVIATFCRPLHPLGFLLVSLSTLVVIGRLISRKIQIPETAPFKALQFFGIVSYSVYLIHLPLLGAVQKVFWKYSFWPHPFVLFLVCCLSWMPILLLSWLCYRTVELPGIAAGKKLLGKAD